MTSHDRKWKELKVTEISKLAKEYPFIAVVTLNELPANILSVLRKKLKNDAKIIVAKTRIVQKAFKDSGVDTTKLDDFVKESIAIIFSNKNPFELFSFVKKNKGDTVAKVGDIAEQDILVQSGDTGLPPGPALTTLKAAGLKVKVAGPTISIDKDKIVTKKGGEVTAEVADVLGKLNMKPMKVGMQIIGVLDKEANEYFSAGVLDVDEEELFNKFITAYKHALNLSVEAGYYNDASTEVIIIKAEREAKAVKEETDSSETKEEVKEEVKTDKAKLEEEKEDTLTSTEEKKEEQVEKKDENKKEENSEVLEEAKEENAQMPKEEKEEISEQAVSSTEQSDGSASTPPSEMGAEQAVSSTEQSDGSASTPPSEMGAEKPVEETTEEKKKEVN